MRIVKRTLLAGIVVTLLSCTFCYAETYDFPNMSSVELQEVKNIIDEEIKQNHKPDSDETSSVADATKAFVEDYYGEDNVEWAWVDYSYTKEWTFFTMKTHADIKKQDGGKAQYDVYSEVFADGDNYQVVYCKIGTEEIFNKRSDVITDQRILQLLGIQTGEAGETQSEDTADAPEEEVPQATNTEEVPSETTAVDNTPLAKRGDKGDNVLEVQQMLARLGYLSGKPDGAFGGGTESAVIQFQSDNGFEADGIVTQTVLDAMRTAAENAPEPEEVISISAVSLYNEFDDNAIAAEAAYKGKTVQVTGTIGSIDTDILGTPYVCLDADEYGWSSVQCYFSNDDKASLTGLKTGQKVTIKGTCDSMSLTNVLVKKCAIVD